MTACWRSISISRSPAGWPPGCGSKGYRWRLLPEFSAQAELYRAAAFLSIHCDSCVDLSGFKVARMTHATTPEEEDRLVSLLYEQYAAATGLEPNTDTITDDMRQYHAFRQIDPDTPGAIIECGFMGGDRHLLTEEQDRVAVGIANGLLAFLRSSILIAPPSLRRLIHTQAKAGSGDCLPDHSQF